MEVSSERLKKIGYNGQTYNKIISKLLDLKGNKIDSLDNCFESLKSSDGHLKGYLYHNSLSLSEVI